MAVRTHEAETPHELGKTRHKLLNQRGDVFREQRKMLDAVEADDRTSLNSDEQARYDALTAKAAELDLSANEIELELQQHTAAAMAAGPGLSLRLDGSGRSWIEKPAGGGWKFTSSDGREYCARLPGEPLAKPPEQGESLRLGEIFRSMLLNDHSHLSEAEKFAMVGGSDMGGGYMLSPQVGSEIIDLARSASVVLKAGAQVLPMETSELNLVKVDSDPTAHWRAEGVAVTASSVSLGRVTLRPKTLACLIPISIELIEDAPNAADAILTIVQRSMGQAIDAALLCGAGGGSDAGPTGILNYSGINSEATGGVPASWTIPSNAIKEILTANFDGDLAKLAWIRHPAVGALYDQLVDANGLNILPTPWVQKIQQLYTTAVAPATGVYRELIGDFSQCIVGARTSGMVVEVLREGSVTDSDSATWNATTQLMRHLCVYARLDMVLARPSWFCAMTGLTLT